MIDPHLEDPARAAYLALLAEHGLEPLQVPPDTAQIQQAALQEIIAGARRAGDHDLADMFLQRGTTKIVEETAALHPAELQLMQIRQRIEDGLGTMDVPDVVRKGRIWVGEYPTGDFNAHIVPRDKCIVVVVNRGLTLLLSHFYNALASLDQPTSPDALRRIVPELAPAVFSYFIFRDAWYGGIYRGQGWKWLLGQRLGTAAIDFTVAHEYGHLLAGHVGNSRNWQALPTPAGEVQALSMSWREEFEADKVGYEVLLARFGGWDGARTTIDKAERAGSNVALLAQAIEAKAALIAPVLLFTVQIALTEVWAALTETHSDVWMSVTHPPPEERAAVFLHRLAELDSRHWGFLDFAEGLRVAAPDLAREVTRLYAEAT